MCLEKGSWALEKQQMTVLPCEALHTSFSAYNTSSRLTLSRTRSSRSFLLGSTRRRRQEPRWEHTAMVSDMVGYGSPSILHSATCWRYTCWKVASSSPDRWNSARMALKKLCSRMEEFLMAVMYDDENISSTASSKWAIVTRPGESGFWQENSQISEARLQMSRQRRASPESAATWKQGFLFLVWRQSVCPRSSQLKPGGWGPVFFGDNASQFEHPSQHVMSFRGCLGNGSMNQNQEGRKPQS